MIRLILTSPAGFAIDQLTQVQQEVIQSVFAQYVLPMPGTIAYGNSTYTTTVPDPASTEENPLPDIIEVFTGSVILDAVVYDNFNPQALVQLDLPFAILGQWSWDGKAEVLTTDTPLDPSFINYLPDTIAEDGTVAPPILHIPHGFAGWPEVIL